MNIPFVGGAYALSSPNQSSQRCINWMVEQTEQGGATKTALVPTPGLLLYDSVGTGPIRGTLVFENRMYVISGNEVYAFTGNSSVLLGTILTSTGVVSMDVNGPQVMLVDGTAGYIITIATQVLAQITDTDFPNGVRCVCCLQNFFIVGADGTQQFEISSPLDGFTWNGLDFASKEGAPDPIVGMIADHSELWLIGSKDAEVWAYTGNTDFPFERNQGVFIQQGTCSPNVICRMDNSIFWLGQSENGAGIVWRAVGYTPSRISTYAIEQAFLLDNVSTSNGSSATDIALLAIQQLRLGQTPAFISSQLATAMTATTLVYVAASSSMATFDGTTYTLVSDYDAATLIAPRIVNLDEFATDVYASGAAPTIPFPSTSGPLLDTATAYAYQQAGHTFFVVNTNEATWVFDAATQEWHQRAYLNHKTGQLERHRANTHCYFNGRHIVGDYENGNLYVLDLDTRTDKGVPIKRVRSTVEEYDANEYGRIFYQTLELQFQAGVGTVSGSGSDPKIAMRYSNDGGHTWSSERTGTMGKIGQFYARCKWEQLGSGRHRVWEISTVDPVIPVILGAAVRIGAVEKRTA